MSKKEEKAKELAQEKYCTGNNELPEYRIAQIHAWRDGYISGYHAAMEYLYKLPLDKMVKEIVKEIKGE